MSEEKAIEEIIKEKMNLIVTKLDEKADNAEIQKLKLELEELRAKATEETNAKLQKSYDEVNEILIKQGETISRIEANGGKNVKEGEFITLIKSNKEAIEKSAQKGSPTATFSVKANTLRASIASSTDALRLQDIGQLATRKVTIYDLFQKIPVGMDSNGVIRYADWDEATKVRAAAMKAEGTSYPESTAAWAEYTLELKKITDSIPMSKELVYDQSRFAAELASFLEVNIALIEDDELFSGAGTTTHLKGVYTSAGTYTAAASSITDANIYDLVVKMSESITSTKGSKFTPNFALMNVSDINKMKLKKDANNNYIIAPFASSNGQMVSAITIIESNVVTANTLVLGDSRFGKIYELATGYEVEVGYVNDQFTKDLMTMKASKREGLLIRTADEGGFVKCTDIAAALVTLAS